jgi:DNA-binding response OmpR family regulator
MDRGRILILGNNKETTYEIRSLLDNQRYELEIALSPEVGKQVLTNRRMNLILIHSELLRGEKMEFLQFLRNRREPIPVAVLGEEAAALCRTVGLPGEVKFFEKPYCSEDFLNYIKEL